MPSRVLIALLALVLLGIGVALFQAITSERGARAQVARTAEVLRELRTVLRVGLDAETGQRGFLLTDDEAYLVPYEDGARNWQASLDALEAALGPDATPGQVAAVGRMRVLAEQKLDELAATIALAREGRRDEALALVATDEGQRLMDAFRGEVTALEDEEQLILSGELGRAEAVGARTLPVLGVLGLAVVGLAAMGLWLERRTARAEAAAREADQLRRARERSDLLARELNHRVKNLFAVILSIVSLSGRGATDAKALVATLRERIHALSLAHEVSQGQLDAKLVGLGDVLSATLAPHRASNGKVAPEGERIALVGPQVDLPVRAVTPLGLLAHELATNAAKHGALSVPGGRVRIEWTVEEGADPPVVRMHWRERGGPAVARPDEEGFGSLMIRQAAAQLEGSVERRWTPAGLEAELAFPLPRHADA